MTNERERKRPVAFITGAARGIGQAIAFALAEAGFDVVVNDRSADSADAADTLAGIASRGSKAIYAGGDLADLAAHEGLVDAAFAAFGTVDCLVNNAGVPVLSPVDVLESSLASYDDCLDTNLRGPFFLTQRVARRMAVNSGNGSYRSVIFIGSIRSEVVSTNRAEYCISKAGVSMMAKIFAVRLAEIGIAVYEVRPGIIRTAQTAGSAARFEAMFAEKRFPQPRWGEPGEVGKAAALLATGQLPYSVGQVVHVDGGLNIQVL